MKSEKCPNCNNEIDSIKTRQRKDRVEFHKIVVWSKLAEIALQYLDKSSRTYIEGRLQYHEWRDKQGHRRDSIYIIADEIIMLGHSKVEVK